MNWWDAPVPLPGSRCCGAGWQTQGILDKEHALHRAQQHVLAGCIVTAWFHIQDRERQNAERAGAGLSSCLGFCSSCSTAGGARDAACLGRDWSRYTCGGTGLHRCKSSCKGFCSSPHSAGRVWELPA